MGQSSSRQERGSPGRRLRPRSMLLHPSSVFHAPEPQTVATPSSRRHSTGLGSSDGPAVAGDQEGESQHQQRHEHEHEQQQRTEDSAHQRPLQHNQVPPSRRSRLTRSQIAITQSLPSLFTRNTHSSQGRRNTQNPSPSSPSPSPASDPLPSTPARSPTPPPRLPPPEFDEPSNLASTTPRLPLNTDFSFRRSQNPPPTSPIDLLSPNHDRGFRSVSASLRRRRSPLRRQEDTSAMLTRLLSAAAAATAMSLTGGNADDTIENLHSDGGGIDGDDGSFNGFLQSLSNGRLASTLTQGQSGTPEGEGTLGQPASLEFFRMFRFGSANGNRWRTPRSSSRPSSSPGAENVSNGSTGAANENPDMERMVPVLIVGIRALNDRDTNQERTDGMPSFLDSLTTGPTSISVDSGEPSAPQEPELSPQERRRSRRSTIAGLNFFSNENNNNNSNGNHTSNTRQEEPSRPVTSQDWPSDSPPGPLPPPTTPASPGLSALSSTSTTPARRSSMSSIAELSSSTPSRRESLYRRLTGTTLEPTMEEQQGNVENPQPRPRGLRRRPRINSWASGPRHDSRRNGMLMEPTDEAPTEASSTRSWIIYILGGNYPENHPILTTPSLFTDSPTYEDMLLLSTLLGSAKPPVATAEDVASAGGLFKVRIVGERHVAWEMEGEEYFEILPTDRCQICLSEYSVDEQMRKLKTCGHVFHSECVDQWITTANNSCPLCRAQGVEEKRPSSDRPADEEMTAGPSAYATA